MSIDKSLNVYDDLPKEIKMAIDDYLPSQSQNPPGFLEIQKETCQECCDYGCGCGCDCGCGCGGDDNIWCYLWKGCAVIAFSYLYFNVLSNGVALFFGDTLCDNWVWQTCNTFIYYPPEKIQYFTLSLATFVGFLLHVGATLPLIIGIIHHIYSQNLSMGVYIIYLYISWFFLWIPLSLFTGKVLAVQTFTECEKYSEYIIAIDRDWVENSIRGAFFWNLSRTKLRTFGVGKGAYFDGNLPGNDDEYNDCLNKGFWILFIPIAIILPCIVIIIAYSCKRYLNIQKSVIEKYENKNNK